MIPITIGGGSESEFKYRDYYASLAEEFRSEELTTIVSRAQLEALRTESLGLAYRVDARIEQMVNGLIDSAKVLR